MAFDAFVADGYVELSFHGHGDFSEHTAGRAEAFALCEAEGLPLLVDLRAAILDLPTPQLMEFGRSMDIAPRDLRIAVLIREKDFPPDVITAAARTKEVQIQSFHDLDQALAWLKSD